MTLAERGENMEKNVYEKAKALMTAPLDLEPIKARTKARGTETLHVGSTLLAEAFADRLKLLAEVERLRTVEAAHLTDLDRLQQDYDDLKKNAASLQEIVSEMAIQAMADEAQKHNLGY